MIEPEDELGDEALLGVFMAFGAGIGGGFGFLIGYLLEDTLFWGPVGMTIGISIGLMFWFLYSDQEDF